MEAAGCRSMEDGFQRSIASDADMTIDRVLFYIVCLAAVVVPSGFVLIHLLVSGCRVISGRRFRFVSIIRHTLGMSTCRRSEVEHFGNSGMSLIETAFVLVIMGVVMGAVVSSVNTFYMQMRIRKTEENQERIVRALAHFFARMQRLPCPADPAAVGEAVGQMSTEQRYIGIVPFKTIGVPERVAKDGFGNWMTLCIDPSLTYYIPTPNKKSFCEDFFPKNGYTKSARRPCALDIRDGNTESVNKYVCAKTVGGVAVVLISHGPKGAGAFIGGAGRARKPISSGYNNCKKQNCKDDLFFCARPRAGDNGAFDDIVKFYTRGDLFCLAGIKCGDAIFDDPEKSVQEKTFSPSDSLNGYEKKYDSNQNW